MENERIYKLILSDNYDDQRLGYHFLIEKYQELKNFAKDASSFYLQGKMVIEKEDVLKVLPDFPGITFLYPIEDWKKSIT